MPAREDESHELKDLKLGYKLKELRDKFRLTIQDLAARTGLDPEMLSHMESGELVPPVATLLKLAKTFQVGLAYFFEDQPSGITISLTRKADRKRLEKRPHHMSGEVTYIYETLENRKPDKHMEPFLVEFPTMPTEDMVFVSHEGEEFVYLMEGRLEFRTPDRVEILEPGDSLYFDSEVSHSFRCVGEGTAKAVIVVWSRP